jgi:predicted permease
MLHSSTPRPHTTFEALFLDLRHALRMLLRDRAFTLTAIGTLTLAIALNVAGFTLMQTMLVRGYPLVERNDRLVYIQERGALGCCVAYGNFVEWRSAESTSFEGMAFVDGRQLMLRDENGGRERLSAPIVSADLFRLLGVQPALGRDFVADDEAPNAAPVAILTHGFWQRRFRGSADIVGQTLVTEDAALTVIGVMPEGFSFPEHQDLWTPLSSTRAVTDRSPSGFLVVARLADGATVAGAQAELTTVSRRLAAAYPDTNRGVEPAVRPHAEFFYGDDATVLYGSMWAATWFVLLIACANLANLCVARTMGRGHELSTRLALGAGHWRMGRQMLIESVLIATVAGACAWWLAKWSIATYAAATASVHYVLDFSMGRNLLAYLAAITLAACVLFTLVPIANLWRIDLSAQLKGGARGATPALSRKQAALIVGQMIFAVVLLSGSGVLVRSFMKFEAASLGIDAQSVLVAAVELPSERYADADTSIAFMDALEARLEAIPGIELATTSLHRPLAGALTRAFEIEGQVPADDGVAPPTVSAVLTGPDYFRTLGAAIRNGRDFAAADQASSPPVAIVNQRFAETHWPGEDAVGKRVRLRRSGDADGIGEWLTVVGVASNIMQTDPTRQSYAPVVYLPQRQSPTPFFWTLAKTTVPPNAVVAAARREIQSLDPDLYLSDVAPLEQMIAFNAELMDVAHQHLGRNAVLFPIFAASALLLAAVGLFAVVADSVGRRTREIGVRMAVGATAGQIWRWVLRQGMGPVAVGLMVGLAVSLGVNRVLRSQLIGVEFYDPVTMVVAPVVLVIVGVLACRVPARRAMKVDPVVALRRE